MKLKQARMREKHGRCQPPNPETHGSPNRFFKDPFSLQAQIAKLKSLLESSNRVALRDELLSKVALIAAFENSADDRWVIQFLRLVKFMTTRIARCVVMRKVGG